MRWIVPVLAASLAAAACGGPDVPTHSGYKNDKVTPWKKPKVLQFNDKQEAKAEDDLAYGEMRRARWYAVDLPRTGELAVRLEANGPGDAVNPEFDLGFEILDSGYRSIHKSDLEDEEAGETTKSKVFPELQPGRYYIHLYLQSRMDSADYSLRATFKPAATADVKSNFPTQVAYLDPLPVVPTTDDTPKNIPKPPPPNTGRKPPPNTGGGKKPPPPPPPPSTTLTARVIGNSVSGGNTTVTIGRGTDTGAADGMKARVKGLSATATLTGCNPRSCKATFPLTPDQIKAAGNQVTISP